MTITIDFVASLNGTERNARAALKVSMLKATVGEFSAEGSTRHLMRLMGGGDADSQFTARFCNRRMMSTSDFESRTRIGAT